jgi:predicted nucleic-acid-binding protein
MIGIDTNVLLRLLVIDDPVQNALVRTFFESRTLEDPAFVSAITLAETVWSLRKAMGYSEKAVHHALTHLLAMEGLVFEHEEALLKELDRPTPFPSGIADQIVVWSCLSAGCSKVVTFDRKAATRIAAMELLA